MAETVFYVVGALAAGASVVESRKSRKAQEKAQKIQSKRAALENARKRRQAVAQARKARAAVVAQAEGAGIAGGSQVAGASGAVQTQGATNVSFLNQLEGFDRARFANLQDASIHAGKAATFQAASKLPGQLGLVTK